MSETLEELREKVRKLEEVYNEPRESLSRFVRRFGAHEAHPSGKFYEQYIEELEEAGDPLVEEDITNRFIRRMMVKGWKKEAAIKRLIETLRRRKEEY